MIDREFYGYGSGERYYEQVIRNAQVQAGNVDGFFYSLALAYQMSKERPALEASRGELQVRIDDIVKRMAELDEQLTGRIDGDTRVKLQAERDALSARYTQENTALTQVELVIRYLGAVSEPEAPPWLVEWLRDTIGQV